MTTEGAGLPSDGQRQALSALQAIAMRSGGALAFDLAFWEEPTGFFARVYLSSRSLDAPVQGSSSLIDWEPIDIDIPEDFPAHAPIASTARLDFPRLPDQPAGTKFCVRVEDSNWAPSAGMGGFLRAVIDTYQRIALGSLEGILLAWRPMVDYAGHGWAVIKGDLPADRRLGPDAPFRWAIGVQANQDRVDIVRWLDGTGEADSDDTDVLAGVVDEVRVTVPGAFLVPAVVLRTAVALEYQRRWRTLLSMLDEQGASSSVLVRRIARAITVNQQWPDQREGPVLAFRVAGGTVPDTAQQDDRFAAARLEEQDVAWISAAAETDGQAELPESFQAAVVPWVRVYDGRLAAVRRRATGRPTEALAGKKILLLGCGGLGAPIAEHCVRAGAARLDIVDSGSVSPGILTRQPYEDADVGRPKAEVLACRLGQIRPETAVSGSMTDILYSDIGDLPAFSECDLVIDATANRAVAAKIELFWHCGDGTRPALLTFAIDQQARYGVAAVTPRGTVGAGVDLMRRLALKTCVSDTLNDIYAAFFPPSAGRLNFRPDASCSDVTFVGSSTDVAALAAQLLDSALARLESAPGRTSPARPVRSLSIARLGVEGDSRAARVVLDVPEDRVIADSSLAYDVRIEDKALEAIRASIGNAVRGATAPVCQVSGLLLGQFNGACRIAWVSHARVLAHGSAAEPVSVSISAGKPREFVDRHSQRSSGALNLIGFWSARQGGSPAGAEADRTAMRQFVASPDCPAGKALLLIIGLPADGSAGEPGSLWTSQIHAEVFEA